MWFKSFAWWGGVAAAVPVWGLMAVLWPPQPAKPDWLWLQLVILWPVLEEVVFRAGLQAYLAQHARWRFRCGGVSWANGLTALAFSAFHLLGHSPAWAAAVLVPGLIFGYCFERWGLSAAVALHIWYNAGYFTLYPPSA